MSSFQPAEPRSVSDFMHAASRRVVFGRMSNELRPPIIVFGNTRSGTSIIQNVLAAHPDLTAWYEPRNLWQYADPGRPHDEFEAIDATDKVKRYIRKSFLNYQHTHGDRVVVEKTPVNILRIPYVREVFPEAVFLYVIRSPLSFISSVELKWQRTVSVQGLGWRLKSTPKTQLHHYAAKYARQQFDKRIMRRKYLSVWGPRYRGIAEDLADNDMLTVIARQWSRCSEKAERDLAEFEPGQVLRLRYEDFVTDPVAHMERICSHAGLEMTDEVVQAARGMVKTDRQQKWERFDPEQLARIIPEVRHEMERHGYEIPEAIASVQTPDVAPSDLANHVSTQSGASRITGS